MSRTDRGWRSAAGWLLDWVYPPRCGVCEEPLTGGRALCDDCGSALPRLAEPFCERCGEPFDGELSGPFECPNCSGLDLAFEFARPAMKWDGDTRQLIHDLKYKRALHHAAELGRLAAEALGDPRFADALAGHWPLVPVPLFRGRLQWRHFNQAEEIARVVGGLTGLRTLRALARVRDTGTQTQLNRKERLRNLAGAFRPTARGRRWLASRPPGAILVDDVLTTGSTVHACAKVLRKSGCERVQVLTVMRG
ncbi:MAG: ComF family protein [Akkermansiaceae bacterium]|jgi:ComF family protein|nr:ComF family protein [Akkermansiaceae bacterium]